MDIGLVIISIAVITVSLYAACLSFMKPSPNVNNVFLLSLALFFIIVVAAMLTDYILERTFEATCGTGFASGNCFLMDGISVLFYFYLCPVLLLLAYILLIWNYLWKVKRLKHVK